MTAAAEAISNAGMFFGLSFTSAFILLHIQEDIVTCIHTLRAAITRDAANGQPTGLRPRMAIPNQSGPSGPAPITETGPTPDGAPGITPDLTARAMTMCNRDRLAADRYLALHQALASRIYSGARHD